MGVAPDNATILSPDGSVATLPTEPLTDEELRLLAAYKTFLLKHQYREALYCNRCFEGDLHDGTRASVQTSGFSVEALIKCRCRLTYGKGGGIPH